MLPDLSGSYKDREITQGPRDPLEIATPTKNRDPYPRVRSQLDIAITTRDRYPDYSTLTWTKRIQVGCGPLQDIMKSSLGLSQIGTKGKSYGEEDAWLRIPWYI